MGKTLLVLCLMLSLLSSCSDDKEQYVSFKQSKLEVNFKGGSFIIDVSANCNWNFGPRPNLGWINEKKINERQIELYIEENDTYEDREYSVTIVSEDSNCSAKLNIIQRENKGIISNDEKDILLSSDSGSFDINIKSNTDNIEIETPLWISYVSSKSLSSFTYHFSYQNNTSQKRYGEIIFKTENEDLKFNVIQKAIPILAKNVQIPNFQPLIKGKQTVYYDIDCYPANSDLDLIFFSSSNTNICKTKIENGKLMIDFLDYGESIVSCYVNGKKKCSYNVKCVDTDTPFTFKCDEDITEYSFYSYIWFVTNKDWEYIDISVSDEDLIYEYFPKGRYEARGKTGTAIITAEYILTGEKINLNINIVPFILKANILKFRSTDNGAYFTIVASARNNNTALQHKTYIIKDKNNSIVDNNQGIVDGYYKYTSPEIFIENKNNISNIIELIRGYTITVNAEVILNNPDGGLKGEYFNLTKEIDTSIIGDIEQ